MQIDWTWTPVAIVAAYAACVSTVMMVVNLSTAIRDRACIEVRTNWLIPFEHLDARRYDRLILVKATNHGRRPVTITSVGFLLHGGTFFIRNHRGQALPHLLDESQSAGFEFDPEGWPAFLRQSEQTAPPRFVYVDDATGRRYRRKIRGDLRDLMWDNASYRPWWNVQEQGWWPW